MRGRIIRRPSSSRQGDSGSADAIGARSASRDENAEPRPRAGGLRPIGTRVVRREHQQAALQSEARVAQAAQRAEQILAEAEREAEQIRAEAQKQADASVAAVTVQAKKDAAQLLVDTRGDLEQLALGIARKLLGEALQLEPELVGNVVREVLRGVIDAQRVTLHVHPDDLPLLEQKRQQLTREAELDAIALLPDPGVSRGGCIVESERGLIDGRVETQLETLADALFGRGDTVE
jgi:flagellar biosynthesis/type III secretory pathway protein FliH